LASVIAGRCDPVGIPGCGQWSIGVYRRMRRCVHAFAGKQCQECNGKGKKEFHLVDLLFALAVKLY
jgi:hypothetical protein